MSLSLSPGVVLSSTDLLAAIVVGSGSNSPSAPFRATMSVPAAFFHAPLHVFLAAVPLTPPVLASLAAVPLTRPHHATPVPFRRTRPHHASLAAVPLTPPVLASLAAVPLTPPVLASLAAVPLTLSLHDPAPLPRTTPAALPRPTTMSDETDFDPDQAGQAKDGVSEKAKKNDGSKNDVEKGKNDGDGVGKSRGASRGGRKGQKKEGKEQVDNLKLEITYLGGVW